MFGPPATPSQLAWLERGLQALAGTSLTEAEKLQTMLLVDGHVFSDLLVASAAASTDSMIGADAYDQVLARMLDPDRFSALPRAVGGGAMEGTGDEVADHDYGFAFGLARILDGVQRLMDDRDSAEG